jgi:hypothetical protein
MLYGQINNRDGFLLRYIFQVKFYELQWAHCPCQNQEQFYESPGNSEATLELCCKLSKKLPNTVIPEGFIQDSQLKLPKMPKSPHNMIPHLFPTDLLLSPKIPRFGGKSPHLATLVSSHSAIIGHRQVN